VIPDQKTFVIPEHEPTERVAKALDEAFGEGWRLAAGIRNGDDQILILDRRAVPFANLNDLKPKEQITP